MADKFKACSVPECNRASRSRGWCNPHYQRWLRYGDPTFYPEKKSPQWQLATDWIASVATPWDNDDCLIWPFSRHPAGYGAVRGNGQEFLAHRLICEAVYGPAPDGARIVAHSCGKGHLGCVNPRHLRWATHAENTEDMRKHGTMKVGRDCSWAKITERDVLEIRRLAPEITQRALAAKFGISLAQVNRIIHRKRWDWLQCRETS